MDQPLQDRDEPALPFADPTHVSAAVTEAPAHGARQARNEAPQLPQPAPPLHDQIGRAARLLADDPVEIRLSPEELGHVRMTLRPREDGLSLVLSADRSETLDLMRRHAGELTRALSAAGYDSVDLTFTGGQTRSGGQTQAPAPELRGSTEMTPATPNHSPPPPSVMSDGLDLRL